jgi:hypothetical protein
MFLRNDGYSHENYVLVVMYPWLMFVINNVQEALPLVQQFHNCHNRLVDWMMGAEAQLQCADPREEDIQRLEQDIQGIYL